MPNERGDKPVIHTRKHVARLERERRQTRMILFFFIGILALVVGLLTYGYLDQAYFQLEKPVARVGDVELTTRDFQTRVRLQRNQLLQQYQLFSQYQQFGLDVGSQLQEIQTQLQYPELSGQTVVDQMVNEELIRQETERRGITVSEEEIQQAIQSNLGFYPDGSPTPSVTPTQFTQPTLSPETLKLVSPTPSITATLAETLTPTVTPTTSGTPELLPTATATASSTPTETPGPTSTPAPTFTPRPTATPYTLEGFQSDYQKGLEEYSKFGLTEPQYRKLFEANLLRDKLLDAVTTDVKRVDTQVWARHILVADEPAAQEVITRLENGEDFGALAAELSLDTGSGAQGGDLGWFGRRVMVAEFETAAFALEPGEISEPVQSSFGFHIIQVIDKQELPLTQSDYESARETAFSEYLAALREETGVEIFTEQWMSHVPSEPGMDTLATQMAQPQIPQ